MTRSPARQAWPVMASFLTIALVVGCNRPSAESTTSAQGRTAAPSRVVSGIVDSDEILWGLGADVRARVVGVSPMVDDARYSTVAGVWPTDVPRVAGTSEAMIAAQPDLVIVAEFSAPETRRLLESTGIATITLHGFDGFDDYRGRVRDVAKAVHAEPAGESLVAAFDARLPNPIAPDRARRSVVSYMVGNVAGRETSFDDVARAAGLENIAASEGIVGHKPISIEQIVAWDPQFIVTACEDNCDTAAATLGATAGFAATRAARQGGILAIESKRVLSSGAAMADVAAELRRRTEHAR